MKQRNVQNGKEYDTFIVIPDNQNDMKNDGWCNQTCSKIFSGVYISLFIYLS